MVVVVDGLAASGAYIAALSSEHIVAQETSLVGSIGVLFQYPNFTDVLENHRHKGRGGEILTFEGRAKRFRTDQPRSAGGDRVDRARFCTAGLRGW